jgi:hydrogenase maturation protease
MKRGLIVCIGNDLVADDGIGHEVFGQLTKRALPEGVRVSLLGVGGMDLIEELDGEITLVVVDAVQFGAAPGTLHIMAWDQIPSQEVRPVSGHGIGVKEALQVCRRLYPERAAERIYLVGIEGACFDQVGAGLTPAVQAAVPRAVEEIIKLVQ